MKRPKPVPAFYLWYFRVSDQYRIGTSHWEYNKYELVNKEEFGRIQKFCKQFSIPLKDIESSKFMWKE